jgi:probable rRNA maturation factor
MKDTNFTIQNKTKINPPISGSVFNNIKNRVLGETYNLSLCFIGEKKIKTLNGAYRQKNYATDILSFPLDKKNGEIFICEKKAKQKAIEFDRSYKKFLPFLFIHGLLHLKGMTHGSKMEREEERFQKEFGI